MTGNDLTHERELTAPVDLCTADGKRLDPDARGWSRRPLHRANLRGRWGRNKRWDYWAVLTEEVVIAVTYADIDYLGLANVEWVDLRTGHTGGRTSPVPLARGLALPAEPGTEPLRFRNRHLTMDLIDHDDATRLLVSWTEANGRDGHLDVEVGARTQESLNVVIPWNDQRFQFTSKHQARPTTGRLEIADRRWTLGGDDGLEAWGVLDVGRGRWPYRTRWNWGGGAGRAAPDGPVIGLQFGAKWTEGTGYTENGVLVDGRLVKIGEELRWDYDWDEPMRPWRVHGDCGLDVTLEPVHDRHVRTNGGVLANEVHQVFGHWTGTVPIGGGSTVRVERLLGFAEESRARW